MGSINAQLVAHKISAKVRKGKRVVLANVLKEVGYAHSVTRHPNRVTDTKAFKKAFAIEQVDILNDIKRDIAKTQQSLGRKDLDKEEAKTLVSMLDTLIKNYQLLSGGSTGNIAIQIAISEHVADKYKVVEKDGSTEPS